MVSKYDETIIKYSSNTQTLTFKPSSIFLTIVSTAVIIATIIATSSVSGPAEKPFSQIITVGPVWPTDAWACTSDKDFIVHGTLRGLGNGRLAISVSDLGTQSLFSFDPGRMEAFSVGGSADDTIVMRRTGTVSGFITLQTTQDATASCTQR